VPSSPRGDSTAANRLLAEANGLGADISTKLARDIARALPPG
jgi:hypothetical protein